MAQKRDIKRALNHCQKAQAEKMLCDGCHYAPDQCSNMMKDSITLIEHFETILKNNHIPLPIYPKPTIKRDLARCQHAAHIPKDCKGCPYAPHNCGQMMTDALELINLLENKTGDKYTPIST